MKLDPNKSIAFIMSPRLGDSLLSMIVVHNLLRNNIDVTVYGDYVFALKSWFPRATIFPSVMLPEALDKYDTLLHAYPHDAIVGKSDSRVVALDDFPLYRQRIPMVDIQVSVCEEVFGLSHVVRDNGLVLPEDCTARKYVERVVVHPTSHQRFRNWLPQRFIKFAKKIKQLGYRPEFIVSPEERKDWLWVKELGFALPEFENLDSVAHWIAESGWFVGNDSGIGHLASNLGVPTVTLGIRKKLLERWRPAWAPGKVLLPPPILPTRALKEKVWKYFITVRAVTTQFKQLVSQVVFHRGSDPR